MNKKVTIKSKGSITPEDADSWVSTREVSKRLTIDVPISLHTQLKILSAKSNKTMAEIIKDLLMKNLKA